MQEDKVVAEEALQRAEKTRKTKGKEERERGTQLNTEFQSIARRCDTGMDRYSGIKSE